MCIFLRFYACARILRIHVRHAVFIIKFNCFVYHSMNYMFVKCVTIGDVASGVAKCDPQSFGIRGKTADLSYATSSES